MKIIAIILLVNLIFLVNTGYARDPDVSYDHDYGERVTVGGSKWDSGDTFLVIALPIAVVMLLTLPHVFDGKSQTWPTYKFRRKLSAHYPRIIRSPKFPTRSLCESY